MRLMGQGPQADGNFNLEVVLNRGDSGDVHHAGGVDAMAPGPDGHPNTDGFLQRIESDLDLVRVTGVIIGPPARLDSVLEST